MTAIPAGPVASSPGDGRTRASKLFVFKAASIPRVAPNSLLEAKASKKDELRPDPQIPQTLSALQELSWRY